MSRDPTIKDVAQRAGCGIATVSRVLNGSGSARAETRDRVLKAARDLGFEFSSLGRSLQSNSTRTIGCVVPSLANPVFADAVQGAQAVALEAGYQLILLCSNYDRSLEERAIQTLLSKKVDGLLLTVSDAQECPSLEQIRQRDIPCCLMFNRATAATPSCYVDNEAAARKVASAFAQKGHINTGFLALRFSSSDRSRQRYAGFNDACLQLGMAPPVLLEVCEDEGATLDSIRDMLAENRNLTALFASNDYLALVAMKAARRLGLKIPHDLSVAGFDGIAVGQMTSPSLATIVTDPEAMGAGAAQTVLAALTGKQAPVLPEPSTFFSFRSGGSLSAPRSGKCDDEGALTQPSPSVHPDRTGKVHRSH